MKKLIYFLPIVALVFFYACKKNSVTVQPYDVYGTAANKGMLKVVYASAYALNPIVVLKLNGTIVSNGIQGRTPFPGGGYNTLASNYPLYLSVPLGDATF